MGRTTYWSKQQQQLLRQLRQSHKMNWVQISEILQKKFPNKNFSGKQCRQKYTNNLKLGSETQCDQQWGQNQSQKFFVFIKTYGFHWEKISNHMASLQKKMLVSGNTLKNKYYSCLRKFMNKMNKNLQNQKQKSMKTKWQVLKRFIQLNIIESNINLKTQSKNEVAYQIIYLSIVCQQIQLQKYLYFYNHIYQFNVKNRHVNSLKNIIKQNKKSSHLQKTSKNSDDKSKSYQKQEKSVQEIKEQKQQKQYNQQAQINSDQEELICTEGISSQSNTNREFKIDQFIDSIMNF